MSFQQHLRDSEIFYNHCCEAIRARDDVSAQRCAVASILLSFIAVESFINNMMDDFTSVPQELFSIHERGFLEERSVQFENSGAEAGQFTMSNRREYKRLEDKILFLVAKFGGGCKLEKGGSLWQNFERSKQVRDKITHPRRDETPILTALDTETALNSAKEIIAFVSTKVWRVDPTIR